MTEKEPDSGAGITPPENMTEALVCIDHLLWNTRLIRKQVGETPRIMGIVKANAYGHNVHKVSTALETIGIRDFGVANIHEAIELKTGGALKNPASILAFSSPLTSHIEYFLQHDIDMTLCDSETLQAAEEIAAAHNKTLSVQLKVDTGMGRLGVHPSTAMELLRRIEQAEHLQLKGIYTHFADSSSPGGFTAQQLAEFKRLTSEYEHAVSHTVCKHAANSGAILTAPASWLDMVRPGILLYGYHPAKHTPLRLEVKPVMQIEAKVIFIKTVEAGTTISYNRRWSAPTPRSIATIAAGYADGYARVLSGKATVMINGKPYPQVGTVTMDQIMVDLGTEHDVKKGDRATLFGWDGPSAEELSEIAGTISYETLCSVSTRVKRIFI
ncbi:alanine racemase [Chlorobium sp. KB01]|uniref:alanine racemase n=1 Tax=Chlorobium sp. KB01 TaxID=1917528 RepID=UPI0009F84587|nr:alanine racemase [Chlorobium sp. KB01]